MSEHSQTEPSPSDTTEGSTVPQRGPAGGLVPGLVGGLLAGAVLILALHSIGWLTRADPAVLGRLDAAEASLRGVEERVAAVGGGTEQRLTALEQRPLPEAAPAVDLTPLRGALEAGLAAASASDAELGARLDSLATAVDGLRARAEGMAARSDLEAVDRRLAGAETRVGELGGEVETRLNALGSQVDARLGAIGSEVDSRIAAAGSEIDGRIAAIDAEVSRLGSRLDEVAKGGARIARGSLALVELDRALASGEPLEAPLQPLREVAGDDAVIGGVVSELEPLAAAGVPTLAELRGQLSEIAPAAVPGEGGVGDDGGWVDRTLSNITGLVEVREVGTEPGAVDAAAAALDRGDLVVAVAAIEPLAASGNAAASAWLEAARQRLAGVSAMERLRAHLAALIDPAR